MNYHRSTSLTRLWSPQCDLDHTLRVLYRRLSTTEPRPPGRGSHDVQKDTEGFGLLIPAPRDRRIERWGDALERTHDGAPAFDSDRGAGDQRDAATFRDDREYGLHMIRLVLHVRDESCRAAGFDDERRQYVSRSYECVQLKGM